MRIYAKLMIGDTVLAAANWAEDDRPLTRRAIARRQKWALSRDRRIHLTRYRGEGHDERVVVDRWTV